MNVIGFCDQQFPLEDKQLGWVDSNSIGIDEKYGMQIDGNFIEFRNVQEYFKESDFVGLGIIHHPNSKMECFATWNGKLMGIKCKILILLKNKLIFRESHIAIKIRSTSNLSSCQFALSWRFNPHSF